ncbi:hypothetical protein BJ980_001449 [Nocardioides daedukensis]|uniref:DUF4349 domain-containing protein n=1 Tax=Nocardioides daedukensis TaxID=634462 RepID=A0A7Y9UQE3_9ACTN|nr:DUF4349 domain-containing protein [Nocardioides daedukensis]NYG58526.1 hypothetical protein [Nocardioides daedukensis]
MKTTRKHAVALAAAALLAVGGCSASDGAGETSEHSEPAATAQGTSDAHVAELAQGTEPKRAAGGAAKAERDTTGPAIISTGTVSLRSKDVDRTRFDVQEQVDTLGGSIGEEETTTDDEGKAATSRLVVRVPQKHFDKAMKEISDLAQLARATRSEEDVTTQVIDNEVRIRAQEKSLKRIEVLLAQADDIAQIVRIESELSTRQANLDSLKQQQTWLKDQTSMSTITVNIAHTSTPEEKEDEEHSAFVGGLIGGWDALSTLGRAMAGTVGALLPFAVLALLLGWPSRLLWRRFRRAGRPARTPSAA